MTRSDSRGLSFFGKIYPAMKKAARLCLEASYSRLDSVRRDFGFELLGLDFLIDEEFKPWLIEVNTNPCLETPCTLLNRIIPQLLENTFRLAIDPHFPPPTNKAFEYPDSPFEKNKFELIFDEISD